MRKSANVDDVQGAGSALGCTNAPVSQRTKPPQLTRVYNRAAGSGAAFQILVSTNGENFNGANLACGDGATYQVTAKCDKASAEVVRECGENFLRQSNGTINMPSEGSSAGVGHGDNSAKYDVFLFGNSVGRGKSASTANIS